MDFIKKIYTQGLTNSTLLMLGTGAVAVKDGNKITAIADSRLWKPNNSSSIKNLGDNIIGLTIETECFNEAHKLTQEAFTPKNSYGKWHEEPVKPAYSF